MNKLIPTLGLCLLAALPSMAASVTWKNDSKKMIKVTINAAMGKDNGPVSVKMNGKSTMVGPKDSKSFEIASKGFIEVNYDGAVQRKFDLEIYGTMYKFNCVFMSDGDNADVKYGGTQGKAFGDWVMTSSGTLSVEEP